jgi:acyl carrier protein
MDLDIENRLRAFILTELRWNGTAGDLTDEFPLIERNVIDSLGVLEISAFLQASYGIVIDDEELVSDNFRTLAAVARFVTSKVEPAASADVPAGQAAANR